MNLALLAKQGWRILTKQALLLYKILTGSGNWKNFSEWWIYFSSKLNQTLKQEVLGEVRCVLWQLWKYRNNIIFGEQQLPWEEVIRTGIRLAADYRTTNLHESTSRGAVVISLVTRDCIRWQKPDGLEFFGSGSYGVALVKENNWNHVEIESDSNIVIQVLKGEIGTPVEIDVIVWDMLQWGTNMDAKFQFTKREGNNAAHVLAHWDYGLELEATWLNVPPHWLLSTLATDCNN
ncbi:hypothetical protein LIER_12412 [Lithospermum erythrorhizon]|uniref:RNase H type-1 domain-containing protein n=1 Tax=Lithospermum erythrorhizon TaxID=34254 RepID=A0AAV3PTM9_LITER